MDCDYSDSLFLPGRVARHKNRDPGSSNFYLKIPGEADRVVAVDGRPVNANRRVLIMNLGDSAPARRVIVQMNPRP